MILYDCENYENCPKMIQPIVEKIEKNVLNTMFVGCWGVYCKKSENIERKYKKGVKTDTLVEYGGKVTAELMELYSKRKNIDCVILGGDNVYSTLIDLIPTTKSEENIYKVKSHDILGQLKEGYIN